MTHRFRKALAAAALLLLSFQTARADMDMSIGNPAGGLELLRGDEIDILKFDLKLSLRAVDARYQIRNPGTEPLTTWVSFPMPDVEGGYFENDGPQGEGGNLLDARIEVDGKAIAPELSQTASLAGIDSTGLLKSLDLPLHPFAADIRQRLAALPAPARADLANRGLMRLLNPEEPLAAWTLRSALSFPVTLAPGQTANLSLHYTPSTYWTVVPLQLEKDGKPTEDMADRQKQFCIGDDVIAASRQIIKDFDDGRNYSQEQRLTFKFAPMIPWTTSIAAFHLTVDTGSPDNIASLCQDGIQKTGPSTWEATGEWVTADHDIDILFLEKPEN